MVTGVIFNFPKSTTHNTNKFSYLVLCNRHPQDLVAFSQRSAVWSGIGKENSFLLLSTYGVGSNTVSQNRLQIFSLHSLVSSCWSSAVTSAGSLSYNIYRCPHLCSSTCGFSQYAGYLPRTNSDREGERKEEQGRMLPFMILTWKSHSIT